MADTDMLAEAASAAQGMVKQPGNLTQFGPTPMVQPPPMPKYNAPEQKVAQAGNEFSTVSGRKRADRQALIGNTVNVVKAGADYVQAKKQRDLSMTIEHLLEAQQGLEQAKQAGDQQGIAQNTAIINDITADPKKSKLLQKAFNIDLFGNGKNKNENAAMMDAWKSFHQKQQAGDKTALNPTAQKMMQSQPRQIGLSPQAQAQAMAIKSGLMADAKTMMNATVNIYKEMVNAKSSEDRSAAIVKAADLRANAELKKAGSMVDAANIRVYGQKVAAQIRATAMTKVAGMVAGTWDKRITAMKDIAGDSQFTKKIMNEAMTYNTELNRLVTENNKTIAELNKKGWFARKGIIDDPEVKMMRGKIDTNNMQMDMLKQSLTQVEQRMKTAQAIGVNMMKGDVNTPDVGGGDDATEVPDNEVPD